MVDGNIFVLVVLVRKASRLLTKACRGNFFFNPCCDVIFFKIISVIKSHFLCCAHCLASASRSTSLKVFLRLDRLKVSCQS